MKRYYLAIIFTIFLASCAGVEQKTTDDDITQKPDIVAETKPEAVEPPTRPFPGDSFYDLLVAEFAVRRSRFDIALGNYIQQAHETRDPGVTARATRLAQFLRADKATLDASQLWVELEPDNLEAQYTNSTILAKNQRPLEALARMVDVLDQGGKTNFAAIAASALALDSNTREQLEKNIDNLIIKHPSNGQLLTAKTLLLQQRGEDKAALTTIRKVIELESDNPQPRVLEARILQKMERIDEAYSLLAENVEQFPKNRRLRLQYARLLMVKDINEAQKQFEILLTQTPRDPDLLLSLALICKETEQVNQATDYLQQLLATGKRSNDAYFYLGQLAEQSPDLQEAIEYYQKVQPSNQFLNAINRTVVIYLKQGREATAREFLLTQRQLHPQYNPQFYLLESEILMRSQRYEEGHQLLSEALLIMPNQTGLRYARSMFSERLNNSEFMKQDLRIIIEQEPNNTIALNALGYVLANDGENLDEAYAMINKAVAAKPNNPAFLDSLGWVEYRRGNLQRAEELLQKAYDLYPDHEIAAHLGEVLWQLGKRDDAKALWNKALEEKPDSAILLETMKRLNSNPVMNTETNADIINE